MLFYTARIAVLKGNFTFVRTYNVQLVAQQCCSCSDQNKSDIVSLGFSVGPREVPGLHRSSGRVASDSPPVLLGADVGLLL